MKILLTVILPIKILIDSFLYKSLLRQIKETVPIAKNDALIRKA